MQALRGLARRAPRPSEQARRLSSATRSSETGTPVPVPVPAPTPTPSKLADLSAKTEFQKFAQSTSAPPGRVAEFHASHDLTQPIDDAGLAMGASTWQATDAAKIARNQKSPFLTSNDLGAPTTTEAVRDGLALKQVWNGATHKVQQHSYNDEPQVTRGTVGRQTEDSTGQEYPGQFSQHIDLASFGPDGYVDPTKAPRIQMPPIEVGESYTDAQHEQLRQDQMAAAHQYGGQYDYSMAQQTNVGTLPLGFSGPPPTYGPHR